MSLLLFLWHREKTIGTARRSCNRHGTFLNGNSGKFHFGNSPCGAERERKDDGAGRQARIYSRTIALQIAAIEARKLSKQVD
jgi:hypothetical protein